ncbi:MAG: hypothetical protein WBN88_01715 [Anderseniella sp.]
MQIKRIISGVAIMGVMAAFAVAGSPVFAAGETPAEVTVYGNYNRSAPAEDKFIPGPDPVEGVAEGFYFAGKGLAVGAREVGDGIGESGGKVADDAVAYGPPGLVSGTFKGVGRIGEGAVRGVGAVGHGAVKGAGCIVTFGAGC